MTEEFLWYIWKFRLFDNEILKTGETNSDSCPDFFNAKIKADEAWIIAPAKEAYPVKKNVMVSPLKDFLKRAAKR